MSTRLLTHDGELREIEIEPTPHPTEDFFVPVGAFLGAYGGSLGGIAGGGAAAAWLRVEGRYEALDVDTSLLWLAAIVPAPTHELIDRFGEDRVGGAVERGLLVRVPHDGLSEEFQELSERLIVRPHGFSRGQRDDDLGQFELNWPSGDTVVLVPIVEWMLWANLDGRTTLAEAIDAAVLHNQAPIEDVRRCAPRLLWMLDRFVLGGFDWR